MTASCKSYKIPLQKLQVQMRRIGRLVREGTHLDRRGEDNPGDALSAGRCRQASPASK